MNKDDNLLGRLEIRPLSGEIQIGAFSCGNTEIDKWCKTHCAKSHDRLESRVWVATLPGNIHPIGFYSLTLFLEEEQILNGRRWTPPFTKRKCFPTLQIQYFAVARHSQNLGVGTLLLGHAIDIFKSAANLIGVPFMTLFAVNRKTADFYKKLGFREYGPTASTPRMLLPAQSVLDLQSN